MMNQQRTLYEEQLRYVRDSDWREFLVLVEKEHERRGHLIIRFGEVKSYG